MDRPPEKSTARELAEQAVIAGAGMELQQKGRLPSLEELADSNAFTDAVVHATPASPATHQDEILAALRNGVLNSLAPDAPNRG